MKEGILFCIKDIVITIQICTLNTLPLYVVPDFLPSVGCLFVVLKLLLVFIRYLQTRPGFDLHYNHNK